MYPRSQSRLGCNMRWPEETWYRADGTDETPQCYYGISRALLLADSDRIMRGFYRQPDPDHAQLGGFFEFGNQQLPHVRYWCYESDILEGLKED